MRSGYLCIWEYRLDVEGCGGIIVYFRIAGFRCLDACVGCFDAGFPDFLGLLTGVGLDQEGCWDRRSRVFGSLVRLWV